MGLSRNTPLRRVTPLRSSSQLSRTGSLPRGAGRKRKPNESSRAYRWVQLRVQVFARDGGCCVHCGVTLHAAGWECHHRQLRSQGGPDELFNLVALDGTCHRWAHDRRLESEPLGFIVPSHTDPATVPVTRFDGAVILLTEERAA